MRGKTIVKKVVKEVKVEPEKVKEVSPIKKAAPKVVSVKEKKQDGIFVPLFRTYVEGAGGEHYLAEIRQNTETKEIKAVKA